MMSCNNLEKNWNAFCNCVCQWKHLKGLKTNVNHVDCVEHNTLTSIALLVNFSKLIIDRSGLQTKLFT